MDTLNRCCAVRVTARIPHKSASPGEVRRDFSFVVHGGIEVRCCIGLEADEDHPSPQAYS